MRQRALDANGDYQFGTPLSKFLIDSPECVAQLVMTRLRLDVSEWFLDTSDGLDLNQIIGYTGSTRDLTVRNRILDTQGVARITEYVSFVDTKRRFSVVVSIATNFGAAVLATSL